MNKKSFIFFFFLFFSLLVKSQIENNFSNLPFSNFSKKNHSSNIESNKNEDLRIVLSVVKYPTSLDARDGEMKATVYGCKESFCRITLSNGDTSLSYGVDSPAVFARQKYGRYKAYGPGGESNYVDLLPCLAPTYQATNGVFGEKTNSTLNLISFTPPIIPPHLPPEISKISGYAIFINDSNIFSKSDRGNYSEETNLNWKNKGQQVIYFGNSNSPNITINSLESNTTYFFRIYAYQLCGHHEVYETVGLFESDTTLENSLGINSSNPEESIKYRIENNRLILTGINQPDTKIKIYNTLGKILINESFNGNNQNYINISKLQYGLYVIHLKNASWNVSKKLIID